MKKPLSKKVLVAVLTLLILSFTSCSVFEKADDVSFNTTLNETFSVNDESEGVNKSFSTSIVLNATDDAEIARYKDKIKSFAVNNITYKISNFSGTSTTLSNATISFSDDDATTAEIIANISSLNIAEASQDGTEYELTVDEAGIAKIQNFLKADKSVKIYLTGTLSQTPAAFDIDLRVDVKVVANVL